MPDGAVGRPMVIGEAPGKTEDETGIPFHPEAEAGGLFKRLMARVGVPRERFTIANCVWQRPPANELYDANGYPLAYTHGAVDYWKPFLYQAIEELQPSVIIGLGRTALETLTGFQDIGTTRGYVCQARIDIAKPGDGVGWEFEDLYDRRSLHIPTICTYHPAFLNYGQRHLSGVFIRDVLAALEIAEKGWQTPQLRVTPSPSPEQFQRFCADFQPDFHALTADIETPDTRGLDESTLEELNGKQTPIDRLSFCYSSEVGGFSIPFEEPFLSMARDLIARAKRLRGWNWRLFDWPRLLQHSFHTEAREYDLMDQWRHMHRTLPASVAFVAPFYLSMPPWKHEAHSQPEWYSAMDAIVEHEIAEGMERELRTSGQWEVYERHVVEIISTNHGICTQMARNGLPIDAEKIEAFKIELTEKRDQRLLRLQELVPEALKPVKQKQGLKRVPKAPEGVALASLGFVLRPFAVKASTLAKEERAALGAAYSDPEALPERMVSVERWALLEDFNPASHLQVKALIRFYGHKAKTDRKTKNESSGDDTLKSLITKYAESKKASDMAAVECYRLIRECRAIDKVLGTYVNGWKPASDGLIHATPGIWGDMFRISWRKPNLAATVADKKEIQIAAGFRKCICVPDDQVLIESDWKGMEALLVGYFAGDSDYMRLARLGVHDFMGHHMMKLPISLDMSDGELSERFQWFKKKYPKQRDDAKHTIHGVGYGMTSFLMAELYEMSRPRAQQLIDLLFALFPKVKLWQQQTMQEAHDKCRLVNAWGYRMPFWNVFQWQQKRFDRLRQLWVRHTTQPQAMFAKKEQELVEQIEAKGGEAAIPSLCYDLGDEAKSALAFLPRDTGAAMLKDTLLTLRDEYGLDKGILRANAHDSILAICQRSQADEVAYKLKRTMERPQERLGGLVIGAEVSIGQSWEKAAMREWQPQEAMTV